MAFHTGQSVEDLMQSAETAKRRGPGHVQFTDQLRESTTLRRTLESELRSALMVSGRAAWSWR